MQTPTPVIPEAELFVRVGFASLTLRGDRWVSLAHEVLQMIKTERDRRAEVYANAAERLFEVGMILAARLAAKEAP